MSLFVSLEGPDGSGKSTQAHRLARALRDRGYRVTETREPGGTRLSEGVRSLLFDPEAPPATPMAMALLIAASRAQLVHDVIKPALERGEIVIADRYADSTLAYQAYGQGLALRDMRELVRLATDGLLPDMTIYVDVPSSVGLARLAGRAEGNRLDTAELAFHERVRDGYLRLMESEAGRWRRVDGDAPEDAVHCAILQSVEPALARVSQAV